MPANTDVSSAIVRSLIPARMDRLPWTRFHTRLVMSLGTAWILDGIVELLLGVAAERKELEQIARPLTAVTTTQVPRAPMPRAHYSPSSKLGGPSSAAA